MAYFLSSMMPEVEMQRPEVQVQHPEVQVKHPEVHFSHIEAENPPPEGKKRGKEQNKQTKDENKREKDENKRPIVETTPSFGHPSGGWDDNKRRKEVEQTLIAKEQPQTDIQMRRTKVKSGAPKLNDRLKFLS